MRSRGTASLSLFVMVFLAVPALFAEQNTGVCILPLYGKPGVPWVFPPEIVPVINVPFQGVDR